MMIVAGKMMKQAAVIFTILLCSVMMVTAQDQKEMALANQYYQNGSYDKAAELYEKLLDKNPGNPAFYNNLFRCLIFLKDYDRLEKIVKRQIKKNKNNPKFEVDLGYLYAQQGDIAKATSIYDDALDDLEADDRQIRMLASAFTVYREDDYIIKTYERGHELFKDPTRYSYELGNAYRNKGNSKKSIENYLNYLEKNENRDQQIKNLLQSSKDRAGLFRELEKQLYGRIQKDRDGTKTVFNEMLIWLFIQQKDFDEAIIQAKALDKRFFEDGYRIIEIARLATVEKSFGAAIEAYDYIIEGTNRKNSVRITAKTELLNCRKQKIESQKPAAEEDVRILEEAYETFINEQGRNLGTVQTMHELAELKAYYLNDLQAAIGIIEEVVNIPGIATSTKNKYKLNLGDFYVMKGDVWEATLIYFQVDKAERDSPIGEEARYKNAKLSYHKGEFEWAQAQLKILKGSTTELIANDAIELSVFITDNLGLDTTPEPMMMYSNSELLILQNRDEAALAELNKLVRKYPGHVLTDDVILTKAEIAYGNGDFEEAKKQLELILENHPEDLLGDNATFMLAEIYEYHLGDPNKAMDLYKQILLVYKDSIYTVEARKRFRSLRGDNL